VLVPCVRLPGRLLLTAVADAGRLMLLELLRPLASAAERSDFVATSAACDASVLDAELLAAAGLLTFDS